MLIPLQNNLQPTNVLVQGEKAIHRAIIVLRCQGLTQKKVAERLGVSETMVSNTLRQDWAKELAAQIMQEYADKSLETLLQVYTKEAIDTAAELMQSSKNEHVRSKCAFKFMDLHFGQKIKVEDVTGYGDLDEEEKRLDEQLRHATGNRLGTN